MTPRAPHAMSQLMNEITELDVEARFELDDLDGIGVYHSVTIYSDYLSDLEEALVEVARYDQRISLVEDHDDYLDVVFLNRAPIQWSREPFNLATIIEAQAAARKPVKKAAAKKTAKKK